MNDPLLILLAGFFTGLLFGTFLFWVHLGSHKKSLINLEHLIEVYKGQIVFLTQTKQIELEQSDQFIPNLDHYAGADVQYPTNNDENEAFLEDLRRQDNEALAQKMAQQEPRD
jgi:hypothetical protein